MKTTKFSKQFICNCFFTEFIDVKDVLSTLKNMDDYDLLESEFPVCEDCEDLRAFVLKQMLKVK
jgi:hypothetical protein